MGLLRTIGKFISVVLLLIFITLLPATIWIYNAQAVFFSPDTYTDLLQSEYLYTDVLPELITETIENTPDEEKEPGPGFEPVEPGSSAWYVSQTIDNLDVDTRKEAVQRLLPSDWLQEQITFNVQRAFDWVESDQLVPDFEIDLEAFKLTLVGQNSVSVVDMALSSWPACTPEQEDILEAQLVNDFSTSETFPACVPENSATEDTLRTTLISSFVDSGDQLPLRLPGEDSRDYLETRT